MYTRPYTPERITELKPGEIFVFGSNLRGAHGGGAARFAYERFGAVWGQGVGLQGRSYGIPTMQGGVETIRPYVDDFIKFAAQHPEYRFLVTRIGCGIATFTAKEIAPLFAGALDMENVLLPKDFVEVLGRSEAGRETPRAATKKSWKNRPMPEKNVTVPMDIGLTAGQMARVRLGHIPEAMEDHWFMYCSEHTIHYHRSWTGYCIFEAEFEARGDGYVITSLTINQDPDEHTDDLEGAKARFVSLLKSQCKD